MQLLNNDAMEWEAISVLSGEVLIPFGVHKKLIIQNSDSATITIEGQSSLEMIILGATESTVQIRIVLAGDGAKAAIRSIIVVGSEVKKNISFTVEHAASQTDADVRVRSVVFDDATVNLQGIEKIPAGVFGVSTYFSGHTLLMSNGARGDVIPSLEILSSDVKAGHAASVGSLDELDVFYCQSRGLPSDQCKTILIEGFLLSDMINYDDLVTKKVQEMILNKMDVIH